MVAATPSCPGGEGPKCDEQRAADCVMLLPGELSTTQECFQIGLKTGFLLCRLDCAGAAALLGLPGDRSGLSLTPVHTSVPGAAALPVGPGLLCWCFHPLDLELEQGAELGLPGQGLWPWGFPLVPLVCLCKILMDAFGHMGCFSSSFLLRKNFPVLSLGAGSTKPVSAKGYFGKAASSEEKQVCVGGFCSVENTRCCVKSGLQRLF